jgi:hypothetical protein
VDRSCEITEPASGVPLHHAQHGGIPSRHWRPGIVLENADDPVPAVGTADNPYCGRPGSRVSEDRGQRAVTGHADPALPLNALAAGRSPEYAGERAVPRHADCSRTSHARAALSAHADGRALPAHADRTPAEHARAGATGTTRPYPHGLASDAACTSAGHADQTVNVPASTWACHASVGPQHMISPKDLTDEHLRARFGPVLRFEDEIAHGSLPFHSEFTAHPFVEAGAEYG